MHTEAYVPMPPLQCGAMWCRVVPCGADGWTLRYCMYRTRMCERRRCTGRVVEREVVPVHVGPSQACLVPSSFPTPLT